MQIQAWEPKWSMSLSFICSGRCVWLGLKFTRIQQMFICYIGGGDRGTFTLRFPSSLFDCCFKQVILGNPLGTWMRWQVSFLLSVFGTICRYWQFLNKVALTIGLHWRISPMFGNNWTFSTTCNGYFYLRSELHGDNCFWWDFPQYLQYNWFGLCYLLLVFLLNANTKVAWIRRFSVTLVDHIFLNLPGWIFELIIMFVMMTLCK